MPATWRGGWARHTAGGGGAPTGGRMAALVELNNVSFSYPDPPPQTGPALSEFDCRIGAGEFVAVVGGNGSGKSTLVRLMGALLLPTAGSVSVGGIATTDPGGGASARRHVALVFQNPDNQIVASVVEDDIAFGPENLGVPPEEIGHRVRAALSAVGMLEYARSSPHRLSGGQKQRVAIAGALAMHPDCLCLDEPTSLLDPAGRREVLAVLRALHAAGRAIVLITHHMAEALLADRVLVLCGGRLAAEGRPESLLAESKRLAAWDLEPPAALAAWDALRRRGVPFRSAQAPLTLGDLAEHLAPLLPRRNTPAAGAPAAPAGAPAVAAAPDRLPAAEAPGPIRTFARRTGASFSATGAGIRFEGVRYCFPDPASTRSATSPTIEGITLAVRPGECVCLLGATGSGKTTIALHCVALLQPDAGLVEVDGLAPWAGPRRTRRAALRAIRQRVGLVFQHPEDQFFEERVLDEVAFAPRNYGLSESAAATAARAALRAVGLPEDIAGRSPFHLSGGQMRRVAIASILAAGPRYLVLDEPTAGLDAPGRTAVVSLARRLKAQGVGILLVTHRMEEAAAVADRVVVLSRGRIAAAGSTRSVFGLGPEALSALGLEPPPAVQLFGELEARGAVLPPAALTMEEAMDALAVLLPTAGAVSGPEGGGPCFPR